MPTFDDKFWLEAPSREKTLDVLTRAFGKEEALILWNEACKACNCQSDKVDLVDLQHIFKHLSSQSGKVGVYGMSLRIRYMCYQNLKVVYQDEYAA